MKVHTADFQNIVMKAVISISEGGRAEEHFTVQFKTVMTSLCTRAYS